MGKAAGLETLEAWKVARKMRQEISKLSKTFPQYEQYRLTDQIIRSSRSVSANIAEGYGRFHYKESMQACRIARGSLVETLEHLITAHDEKYITEQQLLEQRAINDHCQKLINGYVAFLRSSLSPPK
jgi:four helix bundle protein